MVQNYKSEYVPMKDTAAMPLKDILNIINQYQHFLITTHVRADGDGIGSEVALYHALKDMRKSANIANDSLVPQIYKFIIPDTGIYIYPELPKEQAEVVFTLDCPTINRLGKIQEFVSKDAIIINIDHHISNEHFGKINWVSDEMSSTGEIILHLFQEVNIDITPDIATALYVAIVTDTGRFMHSNTTPNVLRVAAFLIEQGAMHTDIMNHVYNANPYNLVQLNAQALNTIKLHTANRIATIWLTKEMLAKANVDAIDTQEFADIPVSIDGVCIGVLLREMTKPNWIKVSLRSRNGFSVNT